jgi:hypothetical protein
VDPICLPTSHTISRWDVRRTPVVLTLITGKMRQQGDGLNGLAEAHFISQDAVEALVVHGDQPLKADMLVLAQLVLEQEWYLGLHLGRRQRVARRLVLLVLLN